MMFDFKTLVGMAVRTITNPREGAEEILALGIPRAALWPLLALVVVISTFIVQVINIIGSMQGAEPAPGIYGQPLALGSIEFVILAVAAFAIYRVGRGFGGKGTLEESVLLVAWMQFVMILLQVAQLVLMFLMPFLAQLVGMASIVLFFWLMTNFIAVVHGFRSLAQVFLMMIVVAFGLIILFSIVLAMLGVQVPGVAL